MFLLRWLRKTNIIPEARKLALYPPFFFMGARIIHVSSDFRELRVKLPLRWYGRNHYGTMFGGFMASLADPLPAILCQKIFPDIEVWTKKMSIEFIRPGRTDLEFQISITDDHMRSIATDLERSGRAKPTFHCKYVDTSGKVVALIENTVSLRRRDSQTLQDDIKKMARALRRITEDRQAQTKGQGTIEASAADSETPEKLLSALLMDFYQRQTNDPILCHFFMDKNIEEIAGKQTGFLLKMLGFAKAYTGKSPADAHKNLPELLQGHFGRRAQILRETLTHWGFGDDEIQSWLHFEHSFEAQIKAGQNKPSAS